MASRGLLKKVDLNAPLKLNADDTTKAIMQELGVNSQKIRSIALASAYRAPETFLEARGEAMTTAGGKAAAAYISLYDELTKNGATVEYAKERAWEMADYIYNSGILAWDEMHPGLEVIDPALRNKHESVAKTSRAILDGAINDPRDGFPSLKPISRTRAKKTKP